MSLDKLIAAWAMSPQMQLYLARMAFEFSQYGPKAHAFADSCETKDYSILHDEFTADRAEFERLGAEWRAERDRSRGDGSSE